MDSKKASGQKIKSVEPAGAFWRPGDNPPDDLPQVAFAGRSNVGKSTLINKLCGRHKLAAASGTPGKTRKLHFFLANSVFYLVDLPGYGFTKLPVEVREKWQRLIEGYLERSRGLRGVVCLVDSRHILMDSDRKMLHYLAGKGIPTLVALTKADKLKRAQQSQAVATLLKEMGGALERGQVLLTSSTSGLGMTELEQAVLELVAPQADETPGGTSVGQQIQRDDRE
ncbi:ribosome biogenesis GTP-binding protein YihA/YsxC [bacterium]|nr:ribosome biogenesis GTP-binding protein YihA/YsxC [bacterium]